MDRLRHWHWRQPVGISSRVEATQYETGRLTIEGALLLGPDRLCVVMDRPTCYYVKHRSRMRILRILKIFRNYEF